MTWISTNINFWRGLFGKKVPPRILFHSFVSCSSISSPISFIFPFPPSSSPHLMNLQPYHQLQPPSMHPKNSPRFSLQPIMPMFISYSLLSPYGFSFIRIPPPLHNQRTKIKSPVTRTIHAHPPLKNQKRNETYSTQINRLDGGNVEWF